MTADYTFLEYTYNSKHTNAKNIANCLFKMGFAERSVHISGRASFWTQNNVIILLKQSDKVQDPKISGMGFTGNPENFYSDYNPIFDADIDMWVITSDSGMRYIILDSESFSLGSANLPNYHVIDNEVYTNCGFNFISGLRINNPTFTDKEILYGIGFRDTKSSENYDTLVSSNNRFTVLCKKNGKDDTKTIILDTDDIFSTTASLVVNNVDLKEFDIDLSSLDFGKMNHKIAGYNLLAFGNNDSYTIENFIPNALPKTDIVFRTRKQYLHITEKTLDTHYGVGANC